MNGLAVDSDASILYSGGRDGLICAWDLNLNLKNPIVPDYDAKLPTPPPTSFRQQVQAHTHWINDIALVQSNQALVSASSDITVKLWRPASADRMPPQPIGLHSDYVKVLAVPSGSSDWIASGGLDRKINLWDLNGAGRKLSIDVGEDEAGGMTSKEKGSVYALAATNNMLASGGPESTVRVWDPRTGKRITKLVGHTDNVRDVLVSQDGTTIMTASSDRTVKVWSTLAGRCMFTLTMHDASVWSLFSTHPDLSIFYSTDKNGLIVKTDTRDTIELDEGLSVSVAQEHEGVLKVVSAGDCLWTATSRPSISRWRDVNTDDAEIDVPENYSMQRGSIATGRFRMPSSPNQQDGLTRPRTTSRAKRRLPLKHVLRLSNTAPFPALEAPDNDMRPTIMERSGSKQEQTPPELITMEPVRSQPDFSIEGQNGLIKHVMLNDRKRVLTLDTAGEVVMWDLLKCVPIKSFGKRHIEDVKDEITTTATVANWCTVDTRTGSVAVILEENACFDAEMYADELELDEGIEFKDDQRINLGKWVLRYLFSNLITEELRRDQTFRSQLLNAHEEKKLQRENAPGNIQIPQTQVNGWHTDGADGETSTPRPTNGAAKPVTPGLSIGVATPGPANLSSPTKASAGANALTPTAEEGAPLDRQRSVTSQPRQSSDRNSDYFSASKAPNPDLVTPTAVPKAPVTPGESAIADDPAMTASGDGTPKDTPTGKEAGLFGKKFSMRGMSFSGMKKIGRTQATDKDKPAVVEEKEEGTESDSRSSKTSSSRNVDDNLLGTIQKIRYGYEDSIQHQIQGQQAHENGLPVPAIPQVELQSAIVPSLPAETPVLKPPANTTILIQEDRPEAGGVADLFEGTVGSLGTQCDLVEKAAPMWLGEVLLRNQTPVKDVVKISFILEPYQGSGLVSIASDGNNRLNANRMLRTKKILSYVAERIEPAPAQGEERMKPEEYLELWCQNQVSDTQFYSRVVCVLIFEQIVPATMTLATIRSHLWRGGGDIVLYYKANGKRQILHAPPAPSSIPISPKPESNGEAAPATEGDAANPASS